MWILGLIFVGALVEAIDLIFAPIEQAINEEFANKTRRLIENQ